MVYREDELMHYGRKGMKWYQNIYTKHKQSQLKKKRKKSLEKARKTKDINKKNAEVRAKKLKAGKIKIKDMTDDELKAFTNRINLEKDYKEAVSKNKSTGAQVLEAVFKEGSKNSLTNMYTQALNSGITYAGNKVMKKLFDSQVTDKKMSKETANSFVEELKLYTNNKRK